MTTAIVLTSNMRAMLENVLGEQTDRLSSDSQLRAFSLTWNSDERDEVRQLLTESYGIAFKDVLTDEQLEDEWGYLLESPRLDTARGTFLLWLAESQARSTPMLAPDCGSLMKKFRVQNAAINDTEAQIIRGMIRTSEYVVVGIGRSGQAKYCVSPDWYEHYARIRSLLS